MRKGILLAVLVAACSKTDTPAVDTTAAAAAAAPAPPPAPAKITAADVAGTWNGQSKREGSDSVANQWTVKSSSDSTGTLTFAGQKTAVPFTTRYDADSMIATSAAYTDPGLPKGAPKVTFRSVGRLKDGKLAGTATLMLASKPDSVVGRSTWEATKAP